MTPDAEAEARFMQMANAAGLTDCGCRVSNHNRSFNAWARGAGQQDTFTVEQSVDGGVVTDEQIATGGGPSSDNTVSPR
jgi:hypothetical protein